MAAQSLISHNAGNDQSLNDSPVDSLSALITAMLEHTSYRLGVWNSDWCWRSGMVVCQFPAAPNTAMQLTQIKKEGSAIITLAGDRRLLHPTLPSSGVSTGMKRGICSKMTVSPTAITSAGDSFDLGREPAITNKRLRRAGRVSCCEARHCDRWFKSTLGSLVIVAAGSNHPLLLCC